MPAARAAEPASRLCADELIFGGTFRDVTVKPGTWCLIGDATVTGAFRAAGASSIGIFSGTTIAGDVTITRTSSNPDATGETFGGSANGICTTTIGGDLTIERSGKDASWNVGSTNYPPFVNFSNCVFSNTVRGRVRFADNAASANAIGGNEIGGDLVCERNGGFADGVVQSDTPNRVHGASRGDCGFGGGSPAAGSPTPRPACASRRRFVIHLDRRLATARVVVRSTPASRTARVLRARRLRAVIDLRGLPEQRVVVTVRGRTRDGRLRQFARTYRSCAG
jgi:hypothetical protein